MHSSDLHSELIYQNLEWKMIESVMTFNIFNVIFDVVKPEIDDNIYLGILK